MYNASFASLAGAFAIINSALSLPAGLVPSLLTRPEIEETTPRLVQYVQTFHPQGGESGHLSLLPLIERNTGVTHVVLAALHINGPHGNITLNDDSPNSTYYDQTWSEVETLQRQGVKVVVMMGGAAQVGNRWANHF